MTELALTPSQTTGPYLEIGLLGGPISNHLVDESDPRAIRISGVLRRRRRSGPGRHDRDLAGERGRPLRASGGRSRGDPLEDRIHRLRAVGHRDAAASSSSR